VIDLLTRSVYSEVFKLIMQLGQPQQGFVLTSVEQANYCGYVWHFPEFGIYDVDSIIDNKFYGLLSNLVDGMVNHNLVGHFLSTSLLYDVGFNWPFYHSITKLCLVIECNLCESFVLS